jgi:hypothetical protein
MMGKKGQFYIFIALVLVAATFSIARTNPFSVPTQDTFAELRTNFVQEGSIVINNALYESANVSARFESYADTYRTYARGKEPGFRYATMLRDGDVLVVRNMLSTGINVSASGTNYRVEQDEVLTITPADFTVHVGRINYAYTLSGQDYQLHALFRQQSGNEIRVATT